MNDRMMILKMEQATFSKRTEYTIAINSIFGASSQAFGSFSAITATKADRKVTKKQQTRVTTSSSGYSLII